MKNLFERYSPVWAPDGPGGSASASPAAAPSAPSGASASPGSDTAPSPSPATSSPAPSAPPSSSPPGPASGTGAGEAFDFGSMFDGPDGDPAVALAGTAPPTAPPQAEPPPSPPQGVPPAAAPVEAPPIAPPEGVQPPTAPVAKEAAGQSTPPAAASPYIDPYDPATLSQHLAQNEAQATQFIAENMFRLTPEETEALEQDVIGTVPKLLAKVFVKQQQNTLAQMGRMIPMMIQRHLQAVKRNEGNEGKFYQRWPDVDREKHHDSVVKYAAVYRQMHPQATLEQMIEDLGPMIMMANKIVPKSLTPAAPGTARPAAPASPVNGRTPPPSPFVPAGAGPVTAPRTPEVEAWEAMFREQPS